METKRSESASVGVTIPFDDETTTRRRLLFDKYITQNQNMVYKLCIRYSRHSSDVDDNYVEVLSNFFKYIETYNPEKSILTWIHIVTKRFILNSYSERSSTPIMEEVDINELKRDIYDEDEVSSNCMGINNYSQYYNDDILKALRSLKPIYREALLLQQAGYKLHEIVEITFNNGTLKSRNIETVKSRLCLAKQKMRLLIDRNGEARKAA